MFYLLDKKKDISSFLAIRKFAKENNIKKIGHTGTLDPLATGLLLVATDEDTKLIDYVDKGFKTYRAEMILGSTSDTYDVEGQIIKVTDKLPTLSEVKKNLETFLGKQEQLPPAFSAKKINGKRAYDLARQGKVVKLKTSNIEISDISNILKKEDFISFDVTVSRGTYIRSIIHDLGQNLGCGALMTNLRRTEIGFLKEEDIGKEINIKNLLILDTITCLNLKDLIDGKKVECEYADGEYALEYEDNIFGIVKVEKNKMFGKKLFGNKFRKVGF